MNVKTRSSALHSVLRPGWLRAWHQLHTLKQLLPTVVALRVCACAREEYHSNLLPRCTTSLSVAAWNCRGLATAGPYIQQLSLQNDVILSEHWLWP